MGSAPPKRRFEISKTSLSHHYDILLPDGSITYFADIAMSPSTMPALTLFTGSTRLSPSVAASFMPSGTGDVHFHLVDPVSQEVTQQEELTKENIWASKYRFMATVPSQDRHDPDQPLKETRSLVWKRTHRVGADGVKVQPMSSRNWKLVDETTHELLAVFTSEWSLTRCGILQVNVDWGPTFDNTVLITCLSLYEKSRRRRQRGSKKKAPPSTGVRASW